MWLHCWNISRRRTLPFKNRMLCVVHTMTAVIPRAKLSRLHLYLRGIAFRGPGRSSVLHRPTVLVYGSIAQYGHLSPGNPFLFPVAMVVFRPTAFCTRPSFPRSLTHATASQGLRQRSHSGPQACVPRVAVECRKRLLYFSSRRAVRCIGRGWSGQERPQPHEASGLSEALLSIHSHFFVYAGCLVQ